MAWQAGEIGRYDEALTQLCAASGKVPDVSLLAELSNEYLGMRRRAFEAKEPEVVEMVASLKQSGLKLGIISNASDLDVALWPDCRFAPFFDDFVASYRVGLVKPDKRIYELACRRLDVRPTEVIFVGDGGSNELYGATQTGITAYWCTWFLDRWPEGIRPNGFPGDDWRQHTDRVESPPYERLARPQELLDRITPRA